MYRRLSCALTGLPIMSSEEAHEIGLPELARVCVVFEDNSRLTDLTVTEGVTSFQTDLYGVIDLAYEIEGNAARLVISEFAKPDLNVYDLAFNDDDLVDLPVELIRARLVSLRKEAAAMPSVRENAVRMMA